MINLGIFAKTFVGSSLTDICRMAKGAGYKTLQFNFACLGLDPLPSTISLRSITEIKASCLQHQIPIVGVSGTFNMGHPDPYVRSSGVEGLHTLARACRQLDVNLISLCTGTRHLQDKWTHHVDNNTLSAWHDLSTCMENALKIAEEYDLILGVEPEFGNIINSATKAHRLLKEMRSSRLKIIFDPANIQEKFTPSSLWYKIRKALDLLADDLVMAHAKGRTASGEVVPAGSGDIPFAKYLRLLDSICPNIPIMVHGIEEKDAFIVNQYLRQISAG